VQCESRFIYPFTVFLLVLAVDQIVQYRMMGGLVNDGLKGTCKVAIVTSFGVLTWYGRTEENTKIFRKVSRSLDRGLNPGSPV
jgi:hypothetical protein